MLKMKFPVIFAALAALTGCKTLLNTDLYVSSIQETAATGETATDTTTGIISFEVMSEKTCQEKTGDLMSLVASYVVNPRDPVCRSDGPTAYLDITVDVPVFVQPDDRSEPINPPAKGGLGISLIRNKDTISAGYFTAPKSVTALAEAAQNKFRIPVKLSDVVMSIHLTNDTRKPVQVDVSSAFSGQEPCPTNCKVTLKSRRAIDIRLSDAETASTLKSGITYPIGIANPAP